MHLTFQPDTSLIVGVSQFHKHNKLHQHSNGEKCYERKWQQIDTEAAKSS